MHAHGFPLPKPETVVLANQDDFPMIGHGVSPTDLSGPLIAFTRHVQSKQLSARQEGEYFGGSCRTDVTSQFLDLQRPYFKFS